ncbi:hypothetical protein EVAR_28855_1 [Eumeta japonica]|uniref:Uncharacterized protein n=1 Tax=Eumeta variegata TaxID=151549 RepID=A0A4C1YK39_EUMVA|nr:hypothetical protein EVAR_28855_1 [Eumeta japonica]
MYRIPIARSVENFQTKINLQSFQTALAGAFEFPQSSVYDVHCACAAAERRTPASGWMSVLLIYAGNRPPE